ncbi:hypothetical protein GP486_002889 [Trichoglossum hirsutum]|uniref:Uncharacterized protein n=1 Tax=Trichoglossum hirsutum TaxID=265104 RepID=A0A9P8LE80_9PEZI|nr:hypothetical protein GP486_002889 [Trichoglossum hirsutum]
MLQVDGSQVLLRSNPGSAQNWADDDREEMSPSPFELREERAEGAREGSGAAGKMDGLAESRRRLWQDAVFER